MTILEALRDAEKRLAAVPDPRLDAEYLLSHVLSLPRLNLLLQKQRTLTEAEIASFEALLKRRERREPLQYILGSQPFMGLPFKTDPRALIPRNDTEALCEEALHLAAPSSRVLDLCTGSGALAVAMKVLRPSLQVTATDLSGDALDLARENALALGAQVRFLAGDLFEPLTEERFDLIVSNPPYIPDGMREGLQKEVLFEPPLALFAGADGLALYRRIAAQAPTHMMPGAFLLLEIGDDQADAVSALLASSFRNVTMLRDMNGRPRVIRAERKDE